MAKLRDLLIIIVLVSVLLAAGFTFFKAGFLFTGSSDKPTPTPSLEPVAQVEEKETVAVSPDGKQVLTMRETTKEGLSSFTFFLSSNKDNKKEVLYSTDFLNGVTYTVPFNAFSPEGKYVFIKTNDAEGQRYLVFSTKINPEKIQDPAEIKAAFAVKYPDYHITDVTGWGGNGLVVVNTDKPDGTIGPSFWYFAATGGFSRLSTRFN